MRYLKVSRRSSFLACFCSVLFEIQNMLSLPVLVSVLNIEYKIYCVCIYIYSIGSLTGIFSHVTRLSYPFTPETRSI